MHVAIVTETYPPEVNGVALTIERLERGLGEAGHRVSLVRPRQRDERGRQRASELVVKGAPIPRYPELRFGFPAGRRLRQRWSNDRPDAVYVATEGPLGWSALGAARRLGIPVAAGFHTRFDDYMRRYGLPFLAPLALGWMRRFHNRAQGTLVPTRELADYLSAQGFRRLHQLGRAVDCSVFDPARRDRTLRTEWGLDDGELAVIHVGRLAAEKNLPLLVRAFRGLQGVEPDARLVLVGDGPERVRLARAHPDFIFAGVHLGAALGRQVASADLFLFPSLSETFGNVTLEAMAAGLPLVAFDYGAAREVVRHGKNGWLVARDDPEGFVAAARTLAAEPALRQRLGAAARRSMIESDPAALARRFADLLAELPRPELR
ncbi:glycosyltransferase family 4 protein [Pseudomarimonas salicorniae]|uniref:Glycosyltransferase family 1 protein n=1 Tax=Pseudomarimonas salicorniae TaxID=2933270 RepID=A0ABT0GDH1_9GAMM|nr:glycosyltransferase family 1 protein [Lysobacter sp. CAU 1642]MCK7592594.1 glycosyltransferase family 1 protein [Lysobacter sp. CAU 1642]